MSGGSYDYAYRQIEDLAGAIRLDTSSCNAGSSPALRAAFVAHLRLVARACRAIEWNDSGDGDGQEAELIRKCIGPGAALNQAIASAETALDSLSNEIQAARELAGGA